MSSDGVRKYVNVRRLLIMIEQSIDWGTRWAAFEPNTEPTWIAGVGAHEFRRRSTTAGMARKIGRNNGNSFGRQTMTGSAHLVVDRRGFLERSALGAVGFGCFGSFA